MDKYVITQTPGTLLQHRYLKKRLEKLTPGYFVEIGLGRGYISKLLLDLGWKGIGYELNSQAIEFATGLNAMAIARGDYQLRNTNWLDDSDTKQVDLVISCMVIEHLKENDEKRYFDQCAKLLNKGGQAIILVPAAMKYWGIEDIVAGHYRRYSFISIHEMARKYGWLPTHVVGLTYPLSNILLPISNYLVKKSESNKEKLSMSARTSESGLRNVQYKTNFPRILRLVLNNCVMFPFYILQLLNTKNENSLVIYAELEYDSEINNA